MWNLPLMYSCIYINGHKCKESLKCRKKAKADSEELLRKEVKAKPPDMKWTWRGKGLEWRLQ